MMPMTMRLMPISDIIGSIINRHLRKEMMHISYIIGSRQYVTKGNVLTHRLRNREDWTRNVRSVILRPISAQFTTMTVVHFQGT
jgi:hypothetical protein